MKKILFIGGLLLIIVAFLLPEQTKEFVSKVADNVPVTPPDKPLTIEVEEVKKDEDLTV